MRHDIVLEADGLRLRPFRHDPADTAVLRQLAADPAGWQWSRSLRRMRADGPEAWLADRDTRADVLEWAVEAGGNHRALGRASLHGLGADGGPEVGYSTVARERGAGVARRVARLLASYAHAELAAPRVALVHATANPASCRVALAAGFALEGRPRGLLDHGDGVLWDAHLHAHLRDDGWDPIPGIVAGSPREVVGDGVVLRPWPDADVTVPVLLGAVRDPQVRQWSLPGVRDRASAQRWAVQSGVWDEYVSWAVTEAGSDAICGAVTLHRFDAVNAAAELGYWLLPQARGRSVATRAVTAAARFGFAELQLERITIIHAVDNDASCRVADRAGFAAEGTLRRAYRYGDGLLHDDHVHARVREPARSLAH